MKVTVVGCGRWGSLITWYLDSHGQDVTLYGLEDAPQMQRFLKERRNDLLELPESVKLTTDISALSGAEVIVISIGSQGLRSFMKIFLHNFV